VHVHNDVLVKIRIWIKLPVPEPPRVVCRAFRGGFGADG
jgi:hypothetical protein